MTRLLRWAWKTINRHWLLRILFWIAALGWGTLAALVIGSMLLRALQPQGNPFLQRPTVLAIGGDATLVQLPPTPAATFAPPEGGYKDIREPIGIVEENLYTERVVRDETNGELRGSTRDQPDLNQVPQWPIYATDKVAVLEEWTNEHGRWMRIIIVSSVIDPHNNGNGGWVLGWLIDGEGVPPPPTPTVEVPTEMPSPTAEEIPTVEEPTVPEVEPTVVVVDTPEATSEATPEGPFTPAPVEFNKESVPSTAKVNEGESGGCVDGFVKLHRGPTQATVQFTQGETIHTADVDSNAHYRICDMAAGDWAGVVLTLGGEPFDDSDSSQTVTVVEGDISTASWYEKEPQF